MKYVQILREALRLYRTRKVIWVFGFLALLIVFPNLSSVIPSTPIYACLYLPLLLTGLLIACIADGGLYYVIHRASLHENVSFSEGWRQGKSKAIQCLGLMVVSAPLLFLGTVFVALIPVELSSLPLFGLLALLGNTFLVSFISFGLSAIVIDNTRFLVAAWTSFRILVYGNNFFHVLILTGMVFLFRSFLIALVTAFLSTGVFGTVLPTSLTFDYSSYQKVMATPIVAGVNWAFSLVLFPVETIMLIFVYLKFTNEVPYPALAHRQNTA